MVTTGVGLRCALCWMGNIEGSWSVYFCGIRELWVGETSSGFSKCSVPAHQASEMKS